MGCVIFLGSKSDTFGFRQCFHIPRQPVSQSPSRRPVITVVVVAMVVVATLSSLVLSSSSFSSSSHTVGSSAQGSRWADGGGDQHVWYRTSTTSAAETPFTVTTRFHTFSGHGHVVGSNQESAVVVRRISSRRPHSNVHAPAYPRRWSESLLLLVRRWWLLVLALLLLLTMLVGGAVVVVVVVGTVTVASSFSARGFRSRLGRRRQRRPHPPLWWSSPPPRHDGIDCNAYPRITHAALHKNCHTCCRPSDVSNIGRRPHGFSRVAVFGGSRPNVPCERGRCGWLRVWECVPIHSHRVGGGPMDEED